MVFIAVQNLVGISTVVLKICDFNILRVRLENAYSCPVWGCFGSKNGETETFAVLSI